MNKFLLLGFCTTWSLASVLPAGAQTLVGNPSVTQVVSQPTTTVFNVNRFERIRFADQFCTIPGVLDSTCIQNAINDLPVSGGGAIYLSAGSYTVNTTIRIDRPVLLIGQGRLSTILNAGSSTGDVLDVASNGVTISSLGFSGPSQGQLTSGAFVHFLSGSGGSDGSLGSLTDFTMINQYVGVEVSAAATVRVQNGSIKNGATSAGGTGILVDGGNDHYIDNVTIDAPCEGESKDCPTTMPSSGIHVVNTGSLNITNVDIIHSTNDLLVDPQSGQAVASLYVVNSFFDSALHGIWINPGANGKVIRCRIADSWTSSHADNGFVISGAGNVQGIEVANHHSFFNRGNGLRVMSSSGISAIQIIGGMFSANAQSGIAFDSGAKRFSVIGVNAGRVDGSFIPVGATITSPSTTGNAGWGILINNGTSDEYIVSNNYLLGNVTGNLHDGGTGSSKQIGGNLQ